MVDINTQLHAPARPVQPSSAWHNLRTSLKWQRGIRHMLSYVFLFIAASFMLFPLLWMISASLKPSWQIFTDPPIWIPQHWETINAGDTNREFQLYRVQHNDEEVTVMPIGSRRYTLVLTADALSALSVDSVPAEQLSEAVAASVTTASGETVFNVRTWQRPDDTTQAVVALARGEGDTLLIAPVDALGSIIMRMPLDIVNSGSRAEITVNQTELRGREIETDSGTQAVYAIGPESNFVVVAQTQVATTAQLVAAERMEEAGDEVIGETELRLSRLIDSPESGDYVTISVDSWQPILDESSLDAFAFVAQAEQLGERRIQEINGVSIETAPFTADDGTPDEVVILSTGTQRTLVISTTHADTLTLAEFGGLTTARGASLDRVPYRVQDGFADTDADSVRSVAMVGDPRQMALIVPVSAIENAFDVSPSLLTRAMFPQLRFDGYQAALETKVGNTYFPQFFRNSFILVILNTIGHIFSCVLVAYGFARLRAPGKNFFFVILLGTMMLPFPVTLVPMYEIFRDLGMLNTFFPLFIRSFFGNAFLIFMLRQFFAAIPRELEEAARIDGASQLQIVWRIFVPLSKPAIATIVIFTFWWTWNSFLEPLIFLNSPDLFPVAIGLNFFKDQYGTIYYDRLISASVLSMLPLLLIFFFAQRYFIEGIQLQGMKG